MIREPAVAGQFYPGNAARMAAALDELLPAAGVERAAIAVVAPHAAWMYSGATAGRVYAQVRVPSRVILVGPNHGGRGAAYAVFDHGAWRTPLGDVPIAAPLAAALLAGSGLLAADCAAHEQEHSLEVQVPMLRRRNPDLQIVPLLLGGAWPESGGRQRLREIGGAIARAVRQAGQPVLLVASSDLNHFADQATSRAKDEFVLEAIVHLDADALMDRVIEREVSMCGVAPTYAVLVAARELGARRAELLDYRTSGDVNGEFDRVVGYGAVVIE